VIETAVGVGRTVLAALADAYHEEEVEGEQRVVMRLHPRLAPQKVAVLPLVKKDGMPEMAEKLQPRSARPASIRSSTTAAPSASGTAGWTRPARRSPSPWTARVRGGRDR
jgi:hypothetical protein